MAPEKKVTQNVEPECKYIWVKYNTCVRPLKWIFCGITYIYMFKKVCYV